MYNWLSTGSQKLTIQSKKWKVSLPSTHPTFVSLNFKVMKKIAILGTGNVGQAFAKRLADLKYTVTIGTRSVEKSLANTTKDVYGTPTISEFLSANPSIQLKTFADATQDADLVILGTKGDGSEAALAATGKNINGKTILDLSNPLDFSNGFPPTLFLSNTSSLGETLQAKFPEAKFVKSLNTMFNGVMLNPRQLSEDSTVFMSGNFTEAKEEVKSLLKQFGWKETEIFDLGDITTARGTESLLPIWLRIFAATQNGVFNFKIAK
jgi:8-hydroxy-5-deazaflavin:NADPH oxidoreductase